MAENMQWGVTPPISLSLPNESEKRANDALFAELKAQNTYEHATETQKRFVFLMGDASAPNESQAGHQSI